MRDSRNAVVPINQIYMGPELPGVYVTRAEREARSKPNRPYDHFSMATSASQVVTEASTSKNQPINSKLNAALRHKEA